MGSGAWNVPQTRTVNSDFSVKSLPPFACSASSYTLHSTLCWSLGPRQNRNGRLRLARGTRGTDTDATLVVDVGVRVPGGVNLKG